MNANFTSIDDERGIVTIDVFGRSERVIIRKHGEPNPKTGDQSWRTEALLFVAKTRTGRVLRPTIAYLVERNGRWNFSTRAVTLNRQTLIVGWNTDNDELDIATTKARQIEAKLEGSTDGVGWIPEILSYSVSDAEAATIVIDSIKRAAEELALRDDVSRSLKLNELQALREQAWKLVGAMQVVDSL